MTVLTKKLIPVALFVSAMTTSVGVLAAGSQSGTLTFKGLIYTSTCTININDTNSPNANVLMGRYPTSAFTQTSSEVGGENGNGKIEITLEDCPPEGVVTLKLTGTADSSSGQILALDNPTSTNTAKNIGIHIYNVTDMTKPLFVNGSAQQQYTVADDSSTWSAEFVAKYVSTASTVTAGQADATLNYSITYQ